MQGLTKVIGFVSFIKILVFLAVIEGLIYLLMNIAGQNTAIHRLGTIVFHVIGVFTIFAVISPLIGQFITASLGEILRFIISPQSLFVVMKVWIFVYVMTLILSPWFVYRALHVWELPKLQIAYLYAGIISALIGGILILKKYIPSLKQSIGSSQ